MALFKDRELVLDSKNIVIGEFDPSVDGFYKNVMTFPVTVKKKRTITINIRSDVPVDIAVANEKGSSILHKQSFKEGSIGPIPTNDNKEMGVIVGIFPGDKATIDLEVWMERQ